jgi:protein phosphatase
VLLIKNGIASFAHVGDSRLYRWSGGTWQQLTTDHTLVNRLIRDGEISEAEAPNHPMKNIITQAVGYSPEIEPEMGAGPIGVEPGDKFMLISDGVTDVISGEELGELIAIRQPELLLECIRSLCTTRITSDNFSVVLVTVSNDMLPLPSITKEQNAVL